MGVELIRRLIAKKVEDFPGSTSPAVIYRCEALAVDADTADPVWRISRIVPLGGNRVETLFAGRGLFEHVCDDREDPALFPPLPFINTISTLFDGGSGEARSLDGSVLSFEHTQPFTMTTWVKPLTTAVMSIFDKQDSPTTFRGYALVLNAGKPQLVLRSNNPTSDRLVVLSNTAVTTGEWSHVAVTYDGGKIAAGVKVYINGAFVTSAAVTDNLTGSIISTIRFRIGRRDGGSIPFNGNLDESGIFFKEFSNIEVAELFNSGAPKTLNEHSQVSFLQGYWQMGDKNLFPLLPDQSGFSNDLTILNLLASAFVNDPAVVV